MTLLLATSAVAQTSAPREAIMVYGADVVGDSGCYGVAFRHLWTPRFGTQISYGSERHDLGSGFFGFIISNPGPAVRVHTNPIDFEAQYQFVNSTRWQPFLGLGVRHVPGPRDKSDRTSAEATGGVMFVVSRHFGLMASAKQLLRSDSPNWDPWLRTDIGIALRF